MKKRENADLQCFSPTPDFKITFTQRGIQKNVCLLALLPLKSVNQTLSYYESTLKVVIRFLQIKLCQLFCH